MIEIYLYNMHNMHNMHIICILYVYKRHITTYIYIYIVIRALCIYIIILHNILQDSIIQLLQLFNIYYFLY